MAESQELSGKPAARGRLLLIDDDLDFLACARIALEEAGYEVVTAPGGFDSLTAVRDTGRPDLVLLDMNMPGVNGMQSLKMLDDFLLSWRVPVIFCSSQGDRATITKALMKGARDYLTKPVALDDLIGCIEANLPRRA